MQKIIAFFVKERRLQPSIGRKIENITLATIKELITKSKSQPNDLAAQLPKEYKIQQKHDRLLTEELINHEYASSSLDVDGAWEVIGS